MLFCAKVTNTNSALFGKRSKGQLTRLLLRPSRQCFNVAKRERNTNVSELPKENFTNPNLPSVSPREQGSSVTEQTFPHSGGRNVPESLRESPVREFDKTSMQEAIDMGHLGVPTSPSAIAEALPVNPTPEKKSRKKLLIGASAGLAGMAIAASAVIGINMSTKGDASPSNPETPKTDPKGTTEVITEPSTPEEYRAAYESSILRGEELTEHFRIPAGLSDEELAETIMDRVDEWENYGANKELSLWLNNRDLSETAPSLQELVDEVSRENREAIEDALFTNDLTEVLPFVERLERTNSSVLGFFKQTSGDTEAYRTWSKITTISGIAMDESTRRIDISFTSHANTDKNRAVELGQSSARNVESSSGTLSFTVTSDGEYEKISNIK